MSYYCEDCQEIHTNINCSECGGIMFAPYEWDGQPVICISCTNQHIKDKRDQFQSELLYEYNKQLNNDIAKGRPTCAMCLSLGTFMALNKKWYCSQACVEIHTEWLRNIVERVI